MNIEQSELRSLWQEAFGDTDAFLEDFFSTAYAPERCLFLTQDGMLASALYWFDCEYQGEKIAYLYAVATSARFRGRGLCHALMDRTHSHLADLGYRGTLLVPGSSDLFRLYEGMGYRTCATVRDFVCAPGPVPMPLCRIDRAEYAKRRRELLPRDGVIQEGENLVFLETQARFYTGPDFLLAAAGEGDTLWGLELLGNPNTAPGILRTLGFRSGTFRAPGQSRPFAMYRPIKPGSAPGYFGLAFD